MHESSFLPSLKGLWIPSALPLAVQMWSRDCGSLHRTFYGQCGMDRHSSHLKCGLCCLWNQQHWYFLRACWDAKSLETYWIRVCILTRSPSDGCAHHSVKKHWWTSFLHTFHQQLSHMAQTNCKEGWENVSYPDAQKKEMDFSGHRHCLRHCVKGNGSIPPSRSAKSYVSSVPRSLTLQQQGMDERSLPAK